MDSSKQYLQSTNNKPNKRFNALLGGFLIIIGIFVLVGQAFDINIINLSRFAWPFYIIVPGALIFAAALAAPSGVGDALAVLGSSVTMLGLILLYQNTTDLWVSWAYAWTLITPTSTGVGLLVYGLFNGDKSRIRTGKLLTSLGGAMFFLGVIFFELMIGISGFEFGGFGFGFGRFVWPALLILLGGFLLIGSFRDSK